MTTTKKHHFDILFLDVTCPQEYDPSALAHAPLGGTEASVIRVAEGLATMGYKVGVIQHCRAVESVLYGALYLPLHYIQSTTTDYFISLRGISGVGNYPGAKKISWQHDNPDSRVQQWAQSAEDHKVTFIGVTDWHAQKLKQFLNNANIQRIYNPVPDGLFFSANRQPNGQRTGYDKNKLIWASSPHKGLKHALHVFAELYKENTQLHLHVFNPGYYNESSVQQPGVYYEGAQPCHVVWKHLSNSLALFYPSEFEETFGLVAAESNALGVPVLGHSVGALPEVVDFNNLLCNNTPSLKDRFKEVYNEMPVIFGNKDFMLSEVAEQWDKFLQSMR